VISRIAAIALLSTGCILVVSPERYGDHCRFAGVPSQCGACLAQKCTTEIDAVCDDSRTMAAIDSCAEKYDCSALEALAPADGVVSVCVAKNCGAVCRTLAGKSLTACSEPSLSEGTACKCTVGPSTNDFACDPKVYPDTICCRPAVGWPSDGQACTCAPLACNPTTDGCACGITTIAPSNPTCTGGTCCVDRVDQEKCSCRATGCFDTETKVDMCAINIKEIGCAKGQVKVESCSVRSPP
jgi:hypothetical protein